MDFRIKVVELEVMHWHTLEGKDKVVKERIAHLILVKPQNFNPKHYQVKRRNHLNINKKLY